MNERRFEQVGGVIGLAATLLAGVPVFLGSVQDWDRSPAPLWVWSLFYATFLASFLLDVTSPSWRPSGVTPTRLAAIQVVAATGTYLTNPGAGWTAVLLVVAAVSTAYVLRGWATTAVVVLLAAVAGYGAHIAGLGPLQAALSGLIYGTFLAFAALVVHAELRATEARIELANAHAQLRASSALLARSSATGERLRIARELHDLVGHQLTALSLELEVAGLHTDGPGHEHVRRARDAAKHLLSDVREAVGELRAPATGLRAPLEALVEDLPGITVHLDIDERAPVDDDKVVAVVRCVQEVITNTLRHANASNLWLHVTSTDESIHVKARDDGQGTADLIPGNGLVGMRERLEQLGGDLHVDAQPGRGFVVTAQVPAT